MENEVSDNLSDHKVITKVIKKRELSWIKMIKPKNIHKKAK